MAGPNKSGAYQMLDYQESSTSDHVTSHHRPRAPRRPSTLGAWKAEIVILVASCGLISSIVVLLLHYRGQPYPQWRVGINMSTLVSVQSTLLRAFTVTALSEILGQLKWSWFQGPRGRPLADLEHFDKASRGPLGALQLLFRVPRSPLGLLASVAMIASMAIGPFTQQALKAVGCERPVPGAQVSVPVANYVFGNEPLGDGYPASQGQAVHLSAALKAALTSAMANAPSEVVTAVPVGCYTGNCTFSEYRGVTYSTMGLCSRCFDTSRLVQHNAKYGNTNYSLPNGQSITVDMQNGVDLSINAGRMDSSSNSGSSNEYEQYGYDDITWASSLFPDGFGELAPSMPSCFNNISTYTVNNTRPFAATCVLYPCLQYISGSVAGGILQERVISSAPASQWLNPDAINIWNRSMPSFFGHDNFTAVRSPCVIDGVVYDTSNFSTYTGASETVPPIGKPIANNKDDRMSVPLQCLYKMNNRFAFDLAEYLRLQAFQGACASALSQTAGTTTGGDFSCGTWLQGKNVNYYRDQFWLEPLFNGGRANLSSVSAAFDRFTARATEQMRAEGTSLFWQQPHQQKRQEGAAAERARADATGAVLAPGIRAAGGEPRRGHEDGPDGDGEDAGVEDFAAAGRALRGVRVQRATGIG
ncbi:hypothetical protein PG984_005225 [Apiospora sp. TS-2023a]